MSGVLDFMLKTAEEASGVEPLERDEPEETAPSPEEVADKVDLSQLSEEELAALAAAAQEPDESAPEPPGEDSPEEQAEKVAAFHDFLGRVQLHGFWDEMKKVAQEEAEKKDEGEKKDEKEEEEKATSTEEIVPKLAHILRSMAQ